MTLDLQADRVLLRTTYTCHRFVLATVRAPKAEGSRPRPAVRLAFVLDRSGSMAGAPFSLACKAFDRALNRLDSRDRFALVVFDDEVDVVMPEAQATKDNIRMACLRMGDYPPRHRTNIFDGWATGCQAVGTVEGGDALARCLILSDGNANEGPLSPEEVAPRTEEMRKRGVSTSTFGLGDDVDDSLLSAMASAGGGAYHFVQSEEEIDARLALELGETLQTVVRDPVLEVEVPEGVKVEAIGPWPCTRVDGLWRIELQDLASEEVLDIPLRFSFDPRKPGEQVTARLKLHDRTHALGDPEGEVSFLYADDAANNREPRKQAVDRVVAERYASQARERAIALNREKRFAEAAEALKAVARKVRRYAGSDAALRQTISKLEEDAAHFREPMEEMARKQAYFSARSASASRTTDGLRTRR
jgi:Ca-activated chloride channel homolog